MHTYARILPAFALLSLSTSAHAFTDGPRFAGAEASCSFQLCGEADGSANGACNYSSGAAQSIVVDSFGFSLPTSTSGIDNILVEVKTGHDGCQGSVQLVRDGTPVGSSKTLTGPDTTTCASTTFQSFSGDDVAYWGQALTRDDLVDADFGVRIANNGCSAIGVDAVRITVTFSIDPPVCGDGFLGGDEACDDGNDNGGDSCSAECQVEHAMTKEEQKCVNAQNKAFAKIHKLASKGMLKCMAEAAKGNGSASDCPAAVLAADSPTGKALAKIAASTKICADGIGPWGPSHPEETAEAGVTAAFARFVGFFGDPPAILSADKSQIACQQALYGGSGKLVDAHVKEFNKCKKVALAGKKTDQAVSGADLEACVLDAPANAVTKLEDTLTERCAGVDLALIAPGQCGSAPDLSQFADCVQSAVRCIACTAIGEADNLTPACDLFDNGADDGSCGG